MQNWEIWLTALVRVEVNNAESYYDACERAEKLMDFKFANDKEVILEDVDATSGQLLQKER